MPISTSASVHSSGAPSRRTPWAATPLFLPSLDDVASGRNSVNVIPATMAEAQLLHRDECRRAAQDHYATEAQRSGCQPWKKNAAFHHYYKKHMCILGMRRAMESSDSDSETSENYHTKLFKRRMHLPITKQRREADRRAAEEEQRRRLEGLALEEGETLKKVPWSYRCPSVADLGVVGDSDGPEANDRKHRGGEGDRGRRVFPKGFVEDNRYPQPHRERLRPREAYEKWTHETRDTPTCLPNPWEERVAQQKLEQCARRRCGPTAEDRAHSVLLSPLERTKMIHAEEQLAARSAREQGGRRRAASSLSSATQRQVDRRVEEIHKIHRESLARHKAIMQLIHRVPIRDPLEGST